MRNQNNNSMRHESVDREKLNRAWRRCKKNGSMIKTAKDLDHTELRKLPMVMMMMAVAIKMNRSGCARKRGREQRLHCDLPDPFSKWGCRRWGSGELSGLLGDERVCGRAGHAWRGGGGLACQRG